MNDPIQMLINAGALPSTVFDGSSRYQGVPVQQTALGARLTRRFIAQPTALAAEHLVTGGERPDLIAAQRLGDPLLYWQIADANAVIDPHELTATLGRRIRIPGDAG